MLLAGGDNSTLAKSIQAAIDLARNFKEDE
jgi:hypothetical protein